MADIASLGLQIDSSQVADGAKSLDDLTAASARAEAASAKLSAAQGSAASQITASYGSLATSSNSYLAALQREVDVFGRSRAEIAARDAAVSGLTATEQKQAAALGATIDALQREEAAAKALAASQDRGAAAVEATLQKLQLQASTIGKTAGETTLATLAAKGATAAQLEQAAAAVAAIAASEATAKAAKSAAAATEGFSFASAGARRELIVLGHELSQGNFTKFAGSMGVLAERTGAASLLFNPLTLGIIAAVGALGAFAAAAGLGAKESEALNNALILTGNSAGATFSGMEVAAKGIAAVTGSQHAAAEALAALAGSGAVAGADLEKFGLAAVNLERDTGQSIKNTVTQFESLGRSPVEASEKLNESMHYLTTSTLDAIKSLADQGKTTEAASLAQNTYADVVIRRTAEIEANLGTLAKGWRNVAGAAEDAFNKMMNVGRQDSTADQLAKVNAEIEKGQKPFDASNFGGNSEARAKLKDNIALRDTLLETQRLEGNSAAAAKSASEATSARVAFLKDEGKYLDDNTRRMREIAAVSDQLNKKGISPEEAQKRILAINESYAQKPTAVKGAVTEKDIVGFDIAAIKNKYDELLSVYQSAQTATAALHAAGKLDDADFYASRIDFINKEISAQRKEIADQNARYAAGIKDPKSTPQDKLRDQKGIDANNKTLADAQEKATANTVTLTTAEKARLINLESGYKDAAIAARQYLDTLTLAGQRSASGAGLGSEARGDLSGQYQIEDSYKKQLQDLEKFKRDRAALNDDKLLPEDQTYYDTKLKLLTDEQAAELGIYQATINQRKALDANALAGAQDAFADYLSNVKKIGAQTSSEVTKGLNGLDDAVTSAIFGDGGKGFSNLGKSIAQELVKGFISQNVTSQIAKSIQGLLGGNAGGIGSSYSGGFMSLLGGIAGLFTGSSYSANGGIGYSNAAGISGGRAAGGPVTAGSLYEVNERGPELLQSGGKQYLMMGSQGGQVVPNGGSSSGSVNVDQSGSTYNVGQGMSRGEVRAAVQAGQAQTEARIRRLMRNGTIGS